ncbi:10606_t:CDS:2 [Gigaspora margarita]|uniref:10606_t:CDS:1 n=1 Tax=Gigaspora margarita TaxID=4874 RepID=A0ABN7UVX8_GIGMA|nr:10606_t:CDS:2 [Gigaspora margarita]
MSNVNDSFTRYYESLKIIDKIQDGKISYKWTKNNYLSKAHNIYKFTAKFWIKIYIFEGYYKEETQIDVKFKDLYLLKKAKTFIDRRKYNENIIFY